MNKNYYDFSLANSIKKYKIENISSLSFNKELNLIDKIYGVDIYKNG